jgi:hypothetical protein
VQLRDIYSAFAALLPVLLGLGLIHLYIMGELAASAVFLILGGAGALIPAVVTVARRLEEDPERDDGEWQGR